MFRQEFQAPVSEDELLERSLNIIGALATEFTTFGDIYDEPTLHAKSYVLLLISEILSPSKTRHINVLDGFNDVVLSDILKKHFFVKSGADTLTTMATHMKMVRNLLTDNRDKLGAAGVEYVLKNLSVEIAMLSNFDTSKQNRTQESLEMPILKNIADNAPQYNDQKHRDIDTQDKLLIISHSFDRIIDLKAQLNNPANDEITKAKIFYAMSMLYVIAGQHARSIKDNDLIKHATLNLGQDPTLAAMARQRGDSAHLDIRYVNIQLNFSEVINFKDDLHKIKIDEIKKGLVVLDDAKEEDNPLHKIITLIIDDANQKPGKRKKAAAPGKSFEKAFKEEWDLLTVEKNIGLISFIISNSNLICDQNKTPELKSNINSSLNKFVLENEEVMKTFYMSSEKDRKAYFDRLSKLSKNKFQEKTIEIWNTLNPVEQANYVAVLNTEIENDKFQRELSASQKKVLQAALIQGLGNAAQAAIPGSGAVQLIANSVVSAAAQPPSPGKKQP